MQDGRATHGRMPSPLQPSRHGSLLVPGPQFGLSRRRRKDTAAQTFVCQRFLQSTNDLQLLLPHPHASLRSRYDSATILDA